MRPRSHSGRGGGVRACPLAFWARELSEVPCARARPHSGRGGPVRASPLAFWAREFSKVPSARDRSLYGRGAEMAFVQAQWHSVRVYSSLPACASSLSYP